MAAVCWRTCTVATMCPSAPGSTIHPLSRHAVMIALFTCARLGVAPLAVITGASVTLYTGMVRAQAATSKLTAMAAASRARARRPAPLLEDLFKLLLPPFIGLPAPLNRAFNDVTGFLCNRSRGLFSALTARSEERRVR